MFYNLNMIKYWHKIQDRYDIFTMWFWKDLKYKISCFFRHRNQWVVDAIPRDWRDKDTIYEEILFAGIINFIEGEKALEVTAWKSSHKKKLIEIYNWAKTGRHELNEKIKNSYPEVSLEEIGKKESIGESYLELYGEVIELEKLLENTNTKHLTWLIKNRKILWT